MPRKIGFTVVSSSGHEENFSAKELMVHAPTVNGWRSQRRCPYPQHITLQLTERCRVRKLQLLAHQYLISAKVEFHIGDSLPGAQTPGSPGSPGLLRRLGYVSLSDNEKTGFKARELKSVHVDAIGTHLRITFHANHVNSYNVYSQVALVAINVLGDSVDSNAFNTIPSREQLIDHYLNSTPLDTALDSAYMGKCESISPLDDLAFDMYQDTEVAQLIRLLDLRKQDMVRQEHFDTARSLKQAIADLHKVGERLGRYDVEKHCAIEKEDFDLAKTKKEQMEAYRSSVYQQLELHNLLDMSMITSRASEPCPALEPLPSALPPPSRPPAAPKPRVSTETSRTERKSEPPHELNPAATLSSQTPAIPPPSQPATNATPRDPALPRIDVSSDERPLPALHRKDRPGEAPQSSAEDLTLPPEPQGTPTSPGKTWEPEPQGTPTSPGRTWGEPEPQGTPTSPGRTSWEPEPLTEKAQREASLPIEVYGDGLVAGAYSKSWSYREDALLAVHKKLSDVPAGTSKEELRNMIRAAVFLVKKALPDQVPSVFQASLKLLRLLLSQRIPGLGLQQGGRAEASHCLEQTWPNLLARSGDRASRLRATAIAFILEIALLKEMRTLQLIPSELVKPFKSNFPTRLALSRAELLEKLLAEVGTDNSGFTLDNIMKFCTGALEHRASSEVRELAVHIILATYRLHKGAVLRYLPPNDVATRRNVLYKNIFDGFARIDGKPVETQTLKKGVPRQQEGEKEKQEILSLQEQLASLKEISVKGKGTTEGQTQGKDHSEVKSVPGKAAVEKSPPTTTTSPDEVKDQPSDVNYMDKLCIFCGKTDESFTDDGLDLHYWKHCPMLHRCHECRQVVEIASLTEHLVGECESRARFSQCPRCTEATPTDELANHAQGPNCNPPVLGKGSNHCPLCHNNFTPGEEAWKAHLMGREGCKQNSRRTVVAQRTQPAQGKAASGAKLKQARSVGARGRPMGRGSRIPALAPKTSRSQASRHTPGKR